MLPVVLPRLVVLELTPCCEDTRGEPDTMEVVLWLTDRPGRDPSSKLIDLLRCRVGVAGDVGVDGAAMERVELLVRILLTDVVLCAGAETLTELDEAATLTELDEVATIDEDLLGTRGG